MAAKGLFEFYVLVPFNRSKIMNGPSGPVMLLPKETGGQQQTISIYTTLPDARRAAEAMALKLGKEITPVICQSVSYVELPEKVKFSFNTFTEGAKAEITEERAAAALPIDAVVDDLMRGVEVEEQVHAGLRHQFGGNNRRNG
jgi:hypothetical protein